MRKYTPDTLTLSLDLFPSSRLFTTIAKTPYTPEQDAVLRELYLTHTHEQIGIIINRPEASVRNRCYILRLRKLFPDEWTESELSLLRECYENHERGNGFFLKELSHALGRSKPVVCAMAHQLGLTNTKRFYGRKTRRKFATDEELHAHISARVKAWIAEHGHVRGALGMKHSPETLAIISQKSRVFQMSQTPEQVRDRWQKAMNTKMERYGTVASPITEKTYSRCKRGRRTDIGNMFFRSMWEANYARYLNMLLAKGDIQSWEYEAKIFRFEGVEGKCRTYLPDFLITENDGRQVWHEVKGWMDERSKIKIQRMAQYFPNEVLVLIGQREYIAISKECEASIEGWEK